MSVTRSFRAICFADVGISAEPASGAAFAVCSTLRSFNYLKRFVNCTVTPASANLSVRRKLTRDVDLLPRAEQSTTPQEGLLSALNNVTPNRFPRIVVVDDSPEARRLIRRILQSQGDFEIFEATDGREAIEIVNKEHPDLVILDLMMPEVDDALYYSLRINQTQPIPVIVDPPRTYD